MDEHIKKLIKKLSVALSNAFSNSAEIKEIIQQIKDRDYNIFLLLEAKIGLSQKDAKDYSIEGDFIDKGVEDKKDILGKNISPEDRDFLRSIKIKINEES